VTAVKELSFAADNGQTVPFERILILGCGGAGKSTLAAELGAVTGLPVIHLDRLYWKPGWEHLSREEFRVVLDEALAGERWIIDGDYDHTLAYRLEHCDAVALLDYSTVTCVLGVMRRWLTNWGKTRSSMTEGCPERLDGDFLRWVAGYRRSRRPAHIELLREASRRDDPPRIYILKNRRQSRKWLAAITALYAEQ